MNEKIIVAVDGSEHAFKAVDIAADLAAAHGDELVLLNVVPQIVDDAALRQWAKVEHVDAPGALYEDEVAEGILASAEERARARGAARIERMLGRGDAASEILAAARHSGAAMIVLGTRGLGDLQGLALGSVARKVNHLASCSVLTIR